nr:MAG TPA: hypothetical protein [Caudoviricetes sp.]
MRDSGTFPRTRRHRISRRRILRSSPQVVESS